MWTPCCRAGLVRSARQGAPTSATLEASSGVRSTEVREYVLAPRSHVYPLPASIDSETAPLIQVLTTCLHAQRRAGVSAGQSVAVVGLGVSGQLHAQLAKARGAALVIGITRSAWKRSLAERLGADVTTPGGDAGVQAVCSFTNGRGVDVVIESTGHIQSLTLSQWFARAAPSSCSGFTPPAKERCRFISSITKNRRLWLPARPRVGLPGIDRPGGERPHKAVGPRHPGPSAVAASRRAEHARR